MPKLNRVAPAIGQRQSRSSLVCRADGKEDSRKYRRVAFDFELWKKHRSGDRYLYNLTTFPSSRILWSLLPPTMWGVSVATAVGVYETCLANGTLPADLPHITWSQPLFLSLSSFALSLLLVFRTNSSYGRFDEARKMWGATLNRCRDITRQAVTFFPKECEEQKVAVGRWMIAFARAMRIHFQNEGDLRTDLKDVLSAQELDLLCGAQHKPVMALAVMSEIIGSTKLNSMEAMQMQMNLTHFHDQLGGCERLLRTPIPLSYTRHTGRFLLIWLTLLPFGLWKTCGWSTLVIEAITALLLLGIDEIGIEIEEPFGILPLVTICDRIQADVESQLRDGQSIKDHIATNLGPVTNVRSVKGSVEELEVLLAKS